MRHNTLPQTTTVPAPIDVIALLYCCCMLQITFLESARPGLITKLTMKLGYSGGTPPFFIKTAPICSAPTTWSKDKRLMHLYAYAKEVITIVTTLQWYNMIRVLNSTALLLSLFNILVWSFSSFTTPYCARLAVGIHKCHLDPDAPSAQSLGSPLPRQRVRL